VGEGDPGTGKDAFDPRTWPGAVEEVGDDHGLAVPRPERVDDAVAEADRGQRPQRQRSRSRLDVAQRHGQGLLDSALILGREARQVGDAVAVVVGETLAQAIDAAEAVQVVWDVLPAVVNAKKATEPGAPQLHEEAPNNIVLEWQCGKDAATVDAADPDSTAVRILCPLDLDSGAVRIGEPAGSAGSDDPLG